MHSIRRKYRSCNSRLEKHKLSGRVLPRTTILLQTPAARLATAAMQPCRKDNRRDKEAQRLQALANQKSRLLSQLSGGKGVDTASLDKGLVQTGHNNQKQAHTIIQSFLVPDCHNRRCFSRGFRELWLACSFQVGCFDFSLLDLVN